MKRHDRAVLTAYLRDVANEIEKRAGEGRLYFPSRGPDERQPVTLDGFVSYRDLGGLLQYIADMVEP